VTLTFRGLNFCQVAIVNLHARLGYNLDLGGEGAAVIEKLIYSLEGLTLNLPGRGPADEMVAI
jgi:hypothetical protein